MRVNAKAVLTLQPIKTTNYLINFIIIGFINIYPIK